MTICRLDAQDAFNYAAAAAGTECEIPLKDIGTRTEARKLAIEYAKKSGLKIRAARTLGECAAMLKEIKQKALEAGFDARTANRVITCPGCGRPTQVDHGDDETILWHRGPDGKGCTASDSKVAKPVKRPAPTLRERALLIQDAYHYALLASDQYSGAELAGSGLANKSAAMREAHRICELAGLTVTRPKRLVDCETLAAEIRDQSRELGIDPWLGSVTSALRIRDFREHQNITDDQAARIFPEAVLAVGGGWGEIEDVEVYGHTGSHSDGSRGWKIHSFGGLR